MFALQTNSKKSVPEAKHKTAEASLNTIATPEQNSVWQSLALRPFGVQAKLAVGQPNDPLESEADQIADRVMRTATSDSNVSPLSVSGIAPTTIQRACSSCKDEEQVVQRKEDGNPAAIQTKLAVSQPDDLYEQEADRVADRVMRIATPESDNSPPSVSPFSAGKVQRKCTSCEDDEEKVQRKDDGNPAALQTKLDVSHPDDQFEQEADRTADLVMRMVTPDSISSPLSVSHYSPGKAQRKCTSCEDEEEKVLRKDDGRHDESLSTSESIKPLVDHVLGSAAQPLGADTRAFFEPRFGHDLSHVRVHNDIPAAESAASLNAKAYTVGQDVVFAAGQYSPDTKAGKELLAHELTHTIQQESGLDRVTRQIQRKSADPEDCGQEKFEDNELKCTGKSKDGPGVVFKTDTSTQLRNFDVDKHFLKEEHLDGLDDIVDDLTTFLDENPDDSGLIAVVGEASTTASTCHNLRLSRRRARCVAEALDDRGIPQSDMWVGWIGDIASERRLKLKTPKTFKDIENPDDRRVSIVPLKFPEPDPEEPCDKLRKPEVLDFRFGCLSPSTFSVVIASNDSEPTIYREFVWEKLFALPPGCEFFPQLDPAVTITRKVKPLRLAWTEEPDSPSDLREIALQKSFRDVAGAVLQDVLEFESNAGTTSVEFPGIWNPASCTTTLTAAGKLGTLGTLKPVDAVQCGSMPEPKHVKCETPPPPPGKKETECPPPGRLESSASQFNVKTEPVPLTRKIIDWIGGKAEGSELRYISIGTVKTAAEKSTTGDDIWRPFVFIGRLVHGPKGCEQRDPQDDARGEAKTKSPKSLADLTIQPASMIRHPNSNVISLKINGFGTFKLLGDKCTSGDTELLDGLVTAVDDVKCEPMTMDAPAAEESCENDCPEARLTCPHNGFIFRFGRMAPGSVPRELQQQMIKMFGCEVEVARLNIGTVSTTPIWRPFYWIQKSHPCAFTVNNVTRSAAGGKVSGNVKPKLKFRWPPIGIGTDFTTDGIRLATQDPGDPAAASELSVSTILRDGILAGTGSSTSVGISGVTFSAFMVATVGSPVDWDGACKSSSSGVIIPAGKVDCGWVPSPAHDAPTPDTCSPSSSTLFANVAHFIMHFPELEGLGGKPGLVTQLVDKGAPRYAAGDVIMGARFMGLTYDADGGIKPVVMVFDMKVLSVVRLPGRIDVQFTILSEPCAYVYGVQRVPFRLYSSRCEESLKQGGTYTVSSAFTPIPQPDTPDTPESV